MKSRMQTIYTACTHHQEIVKKRAPDPDIWNLRYGMTLTPRLGPSALQSIHNQSAGPYASSELPLDGRSSVQVHQALQQRLIPPPAGVEQGHPAEGVLKYLVHRRLLMRLLGT